MIKDSDTPPKETICIHLLDSYREAIAKFSVEFQQDPIELCKSVIIEEDPRIQSDYDTLFGFKIVNHILYFHQIYEKSYHSLIELGAIFSFLPHEYRLSAPIRMLIFFAYGSQNKVSYHLAKSYSSIISERIYEISEITMSSKENLIANLKYIPLSLYFKEYFPYISLPILYENLILDITNLYRNKVLSEMNIADLRQFIHLHEKFSKDFPDDIQEISKYFPKFTGYATLRFLFEYRYLNLEVFYVTARFSERIRSNSTIKRKILQKIPASHVHYKNESFEAHLYYPLRLQQKICEFLEGLKKKKILVFYQLRRLVNHSFHIKMDSKMKNNDLLLSPYPFASSNLSGNSSIKSFNFIPTFFKAYSNELKAKAITPMTIYLSNAIRFITLFQKDYSNPTQFYKLIRNNFEEYIKEINDTRKSNQGGLEQLKLIEWYNSNKENILEIIQKEFKYFIKNNIIHLGNPDFEHFCNIHPDTLICIHYFSKETTLSNYFMTLSKFVLTECNVSLDTNKIFNAFNENILNKFFSLINKTIFKDFCLNSFHSVNQVIILRNSLIFGFDYSSQNWNDDFFDLSPILKYVEKKKNLIFDDSPEFEPLNAISIFDPHPYSEKQFLTQLDIHKSIIKISQKLTSEIISTLIKTHFLGINNVQPQKECFPYDFLLNGIKDQSVILILSEMLLSVQPKFENGKFINVMIRIHDPSCTLNPLYLQNSEIWRGLFCQGMQNIYFWGGKFDGFILITYRFPVQLYFSESFDFRKIADELQFQYPKMNFSIIEDYDSHRYFHENHFFNKSFSNRQFKYLFHPYSKILESSIHFPAKNSSNKERNFPSISSVFNQIISQNFSFCILITQFSKNDLPKIKNVFSQLPMCEIISGYNSFLKRDEICILVWINEYVPYFYYNINEVCRRNKWKVRISNFLAFDNYFEEDLSRILYFSRINPSFQNPITQEWFNLPIFQKYKHKITYSIPYLKFILENISLIIHQNRKKLNSTIWKLIRDLVEDYYSKFPSNPERFTERLVMIF